jgi:ribosome-binding factor A
MRLKLNSGAKLMETFFSLRPALRTPQTLNKLSKLLQRQLQAKIKTRNCNKLALKRQNILANPNKILIC